MTRCHERGARVWVRDMAANADKEQVPNAIKEAFRDEC